MFTTCYHQTTNTCDWLRNRLTYLHSAYHIKQLSNRFKKDILGWIDLNTSHLDGDMKDCGVGEDEQLRLSPREGSVKRQGLGRRSGGSTADPGGSGGSGDGVGHRLSQGATRPLKAWSGILYRRKGRASGDTEKDKLND